jgi:hypothetical protein
MDLKRGIGTVALKKPIAVGGRMVVFLKGEIRIDYTGSFGQPYVIISNVEFVEQAKDKLIFVPMDNVTGIVFDSVLW